VPHDVPAAGAAVALHFCPGLVLTVTIVQVSVPLHGLPSVHESGRIVHENWQFASQPVPAPLPLPKSHCSPVSVVPLPHTAVGATHAPLLQTRFVPQDMPFFDVSATFSQACVALHAGIWHAGAATQSVDAVTHSNVQSALQPLPVVPFEVPRSQVSPGSTMPLPHIAVVHVPVLQYLPVPHDVLSASGVPAAQTCVVSLHVPWPLHGSVGVQLRAVSVETHEYLQLFSQPSPGNEFASSHSSLGDVVNMSPHTASVQAPLRHSFASPHVVPSGCSAPVTQT